MGLLDRTIEELQQPVRDLPPTLLVAGGFPAAMAHLIEEIQAADRPDMEFCEYAAEPDQILSEWKQAAVRITQESLANACRHSKSNRIFLELSLDGNVLHSRPGLGSRLQTRQERILLRTGQNLPTLKLLGGTATIDSEPGKGTYVTAEIPLLQRGDAHRHGQFRISPTDAVWRRIGSPGVPETEHAFRCDG